MSLKELADVAMSRQRSTPTLVADALREAILQGVLKGGQPLRQEEIAAQFGLSRIPVREALRQLEGEGLITSLPHRGAVVSRLSRAELEEISELRVVLETMALRLAIPNLTDELLQHAAHILDATDREIDVAGSWTGNNWLFHATLYRAAERPRLLKLIHALHNNVTRYLLLHVSLLHYRETGQQEHRQILEACARQDVGRATQLLEQHITAVAVLLSRYLEYEPSGDAAQVEAQVRGPESDGDTA